MENLRLKKRKHSGMKKYWPELTLKQGEAERQKIFERQNGCCDICGKHESNFKKRLHVDHDHRSLAVRGLLCYYCNKFLIGRHTIESATKILTYLRKYEEKK